MDIKNIVIKALHENFAEFTEDKANAVIKALGDAGFVLVSVDALEELRDSVMGAKYDSLNNDSDKIFGSIDSIQLTIEAMIEAAEGK